MLQSKTRNYLVF